MNDLIEFLTKCNEEDETAAKAACWSDPSYGSADWTAHHREKYDGKWAIIDGTDDGVVTTVDPQASEDAAVAHHIALHDPARVLRECSARRELIYLYRRHCDSDPEGHAWFVAKTAIESAIQLSAQGFADRLGFREEWRVS